MAQPVANMHCQHMPMPHSQSRAMKPHTWKDIKAERFSTDEIEKIRLEALRDLIEGDLRV